MHLFAELVHAAVGEDCAAQQRAGFRQVVPRAERVRFDPFVPVAADVGDIAILRGGDDEGELPGIAGAAEWCLRREGDAVVVGPARPEHAVVETHDRHVGARDRYAVVETRDEDERVLRAVFDVDAEIGDLHQGRHRVVAAVRARVVEQLAGPHGSPHQARARRLQRPRQVESVRLDGVGGQAERPMDRRRRRREMKLLLRELKNRRHELVRLDRHRPLRDVDEVASGERQRTAAGLPHAVAIAEARKCAGVPVLDNPGPRVAEHLAIDRLQPGINRH